MDEQLFVLIPLVAVPQIFCVRLAVEIDLHSRLAVGGSLLRRQTTAVCLRVVFLVVKALKQVSKSFVNYCYL